MKLKAVIAVLAVMQFCFAAAGAAKPDPNIIRRGELTNCRVQFEKKKTGHVAFIGGSITEMNGYRPMVCEMLKKRFPQTKFTFTDAGISSTCSTTGAFRLGDHVLAKGPVDLFFIEFAVNDDQDALHARRECIRGMEGIIRHCRKYNPNMDIVITYFVNQGMIGQYHAGKEPLPIAAHEAVAEHYGISTIHLAREVAQRIKAETLTWQKYGGTHPKPFGNRMCTTMIETLLSAAWAKPLGKDAKKTAHKTPDKPLDANNYENGRLIDPAKAKAGDGWTLGVPDWKALSGSCRSRFAKMTLLSADKPGAKLTLAFEGRAVGAYVLAGPDAGIVETSIDGGPWRKTDLYHRFSRGLHYPRSVIFDADLKSGTHTLSLRLTDQKNKGSRGTTIRIVKFLAN